MSRSGFSETFGKSAVGRQAGRRWDGRSRFTQTAIFRWMGSTLGLMSSFVMDLAIGTATTPSSWVIVEGACWRRG